MAARYDLFINAGETLDGEVLSLVYQVGGQTVDLTGYSAKAHCKDGEESIFAWGTADGKIVLGGVDGTVAPNVPASHTRAYKGTKDGPEVNGRKSRYLGEWDLKLISPSGKAVRLLQGSVFVVPQVTD